MGMVLRTVWKAGRELGRFATRDNEGVSEDQEAKGEEEDEMNDGLYAFDTLCLVLGLLTNLVHVVDDAKDVVRKCRRFSFTFSCLLNIFPTKGLDPSCSLRNSACLNRCLCSPTPREGEGEGQEKQGGKERNGIEVLVWLYQELKQGREPRFAHRKERPKGRSEQSNQHQGEDEEEQEREAQSSFLCGHLSVLFGLLMMGRLGMENRGLILGFGVDLFHPPQASTFPTAAPGTSQLRRRRETRQFKKQEDHQRRGQRIQKPSGTSAAKADDGDEDGSALLPLQMRIRLDELIEQAREFGALYSVVSRRIKNGHGNIGFPGASPSAGVCGRDAMRIRAGGGGDKDHVKDEGDEEGSRVVQHVLDDEIAIPY